jgi:hypothetical protein
MKRLFIIALLACVLASCSNGTDPGSVSDLRVRAFKHGETKFTADTNLAVTDRPVTLTLRCVPAVSGKGLMSIREGGDNLEWVIVESSTRDTLRRYDSNNADELSCSILVDFVANEPIERIWKVRFPSVQGSTSFSFSDIVILDSVYIPELGGLYHVESDTAKSRTPNGYGYNHADKDNDLYFPAP